MGVHMNEILRNNLSYMNKQVINEEREKDGSITKTEQIKDALEGTKFKTEEEKKYYDSKLNDKIKSGSKLSPSEMNYIRRTNPIMYMHIKRVQMKREILEKKLKNCKSKKEVNEVYTQAIAGINKKDPDKQALLSAYNNVAKELKKTWLYMSLPQEVKEKEKKEKMLGIVDDVEGEYCFDTIV